MKIGITGLMGVGKSTLCRQLIKHMTVTYIDVDEFRRNLLLTDKSYQMELIGALPTLKQPLTSKSLNEVIYSDEASMAQFKTILYKYLMIEMNRYDGIVIVEWALLFQDNLEPYFDKIIYVQNGIEPNANAILDSFQYTDLAKSDVEKRLHLQARGLIGKNLDAPNILRVHDLDVSKCLAFIYAGDLSQYSRAYYDTNEAYECFSQAEDKQGKVCNFLKQVAKNKVVLDAGCGTGKFLPTVEMSATKLYGMDLSKQQLDKARGKVTKATTTLIRGNLTQVPLPNKSVDVVYCAWVLGTILDLEMRLAVLNELKRVCKGTIYLIENADRGEYEIVRQHHLTKSTENYNKGWVLKQGFKRIQTYPTAFEFHDLDEARQVFKTIYTDDTWLRVNNATIEHYIDIYALYVESEDSHEM